MTKASEATRKWEKTKKGDKHQRANKNVENAIRDGRLKKPRGKCPNCGSTGKRIEFHHTGGYTTKGTPKGEWRCSACNPRPGNKR